MASLSGSAAQSAAGGLDEALRQSASGRRRHPRPQVVRPHRLQAAIRKDTSRHAQKRHLRSLIQGPSFFIFSILSTHVVG